MITVDLLLEQRGWSEAELAERSLIEKKRVVAIVAGRWTPSPAERKRIAEAFGVTVEEVSWGHTMPPRNVRYHQKGMEENF